MGWHKHWSMYECLFIAALCRLDNRTVGQNVEQYHANPCQMLCQMQILQMFCSRDIHRHIFFLKQLNFVFLCSNHYCRSRQRQAKSRRFCWGSRLCAGGFRLPWRLSVWHLGSFRGCKKWQSLDQFSTWLCLSVFLHWDFLLRYYNNILLSDVAIFQTLVATGCP